jgi:RNA polymerase sigma-70 factor (ECF subfamily)
MASNSRDSSGDRSMPEVAALLVAAAAGDQDAWRLIVGLYADRVFGLIRSQCGDAELAEEITQSTFCTVAAKLHEYEEVGRFESWIFRIAMNRLRDEMRRRKRQASPMDEAPLATLAVVPPSAGAAAPTDPAMADLLRSAIASLNDADREIINLRHVGGLSFKQLAETLGEPLGTLLARHHRALRKLREFLEERGFDADGF